MKIYVGNITADTLESQVFEAFEAFGLVSSVKIAKDSTTGKSQGFAIVDMPEDTQAQAAIVALHRYACNGSWWAVKQAR